MPKAVEFTNAGQNKVTIFVSEISAVLQTKAAGGAQEKTSIFVSGCEDPFVLPINYDTVMDKIYTAMQDE